MVSTQDLSGRPVIFFSFLGITIFIHGLTRRGSRDAPFDCENVARRPGLDQAGEACKQGGDSTERLRSDDVVQVQIHCTKSGASYRIVAHARCADLNGGESELLSYRAFLGFLGFWTNPDRSGTGASHRFCTAPAKRKRGR